MSACAARRFCGLAKWAIATLFAVSIAACGGGSNNVDKAKVRIVHVSPGTENITVTFSESTVASQLKYHDATTYQEIDAGTVELVVKNAASGSTMIDTNVSLTKDAHYTFVIYGGGTAVKAASVRDDTDTSSSGSFNLRLSHAATGIGSLDLYLLVSGTGINDTSPAYSGIGYANNSGFVQYTSGDYDVVLAPSGSKDVLYSSGRQTLSEKSNVTLLVFSTGSGKLVNAAFLASDDSGTTRFVDNAKSRFKFVNALSNVGLANVLVDGSLAISGIPYGAASSYGSISSGDRNLKIEPLSTPGTYAYDQSQTMAAGYDMSFIAVSSAATGAVNLFGVQDNNLPSASGRAKVRVVNASTDGTAYDVYVNYSELLAAVSPTTSSAYQELDSATYVFGFAPAGSTSQTVTLASQSLDASHVYTVYIYGGNGAVAAVLVRDL